jgi:hypothetical protein
MAATISINFANEQDVYSSSPSDKRSISAKLLADVLGGGVVSGGYVKKTGDSMTGFLSLTSRPPIEPEHAATKAYVDDHAFTRRYYFECKNNNNYGYFPPNTRILSGFDLYSNYFKFFEKGTGSINEIQKFMDVYRNGILQVYGQDYKIINTQTFNSGITAIEFNQPFKDGSTFQINIGNVGAFPLVFGVSNLYGNQKGGYGVNTTSFSGDVTLFITPSSFIASEEQVSSATVNDLCLSPRNLSASPHAVKAWGVFRRDEGYIRSDQEFSSSQPYGRPRGDSREGEFLTNNGINIDTVYHLGAFNSNVGFNVFRVYLKENIFNNVFYTPIVTASTKNSSNPENGIFCNVIGDKQVNYFDFFVYDIWADLPEDIYEFNIIIM